MEYEDLASVLHKLDETELDAGKLILGQYYKVA